MSKTKAPDAEMRQFMADLEQSVKEAQSGQFARVHTPEQIAARRKAGRPHGSVQATHKQPTTLRLDEETLARWRASGKGWQTRAAAVLAQHAPHKPG